MKLENIIYRLGLNKFTNQQINESMISLFDTSIATLNVGDEIINDSCVDILSDTFAAHQFIRLATHDGLSSVGISRANSSKYRLVCGTNLLSSTFFRTAQWNLGPTDILRLDKTILMGVGWSNYQEDISSISSMAYHQLLSGDHLHSVRDEYTKEKLASIGIHNVLNTGCPTMWKLTPEHCSNIPQNKASKVVLTITDYRQDIERDQYLIECLCKQYDEVYLWLQGSEDMQYYNALKINTDKTIHIVPPQLQKYDELLENNDIDYVGTRLHAGIRALQKSRRTIILGVDNRAIEISKNFNIPVILREEIHSKLEDTINNPLPMEIKLDTEAIQKWKSQF